MVMSNEEICREYRQAKDQKKQIGILADQNKATKSAIVEILRASGEKVAGNYKTKRVETAVPAIKPETPETLRIIRPVDKTVIILEDVLDLVFSAVDDFTNAPTDREVFSEGALVGYLSAVRDTYTAIYGPIER